MSGNERQGRGTGSRAWRRAVAAGGAAALAACAPAERATAPAATLAEGVAGSARVVTVAHVLRSGAAVATVAFADTATGTVVVRDGVAEIQSAVAAASPAYPRVGDAEHGVRQYDRVAGGGAAEGGLVVARDARAAGRQGRWTRDSRLPDGRAARAEFVAVGGAPVSEVTVRVAGAVVFRVETHWRRDGAAWTLAGRTTTAFRDGRATAWVETTVDAPPLRTAGVAERAAGAVASLGRRGALAAADALSPAPLRAQSPVDEVGTGPCAKQEEAVYDALNDFLSSGAIFAASTATANPWAISASYANLARAAHKVDVMEARMDACVAAA